MSTNTKERLLQEGDIIEIPAGMAVLTRAPKHFFFENYKGDWSLTDGVVEINGEFSHLAGRYIVVRTVSDGGGTGHGPHDIYPDGWHVTARSLDHAKGHLGQSPEFTIDFYQGGGFNTTTNDPIKVTGKAELRWEETNSEGES